MNTLEVLVTISLLLLLTTQWATSTSTLLRKIHLEQHRTGQFHDHQKNQPQGL